MGEHHHARQSQPETRRRNQGLYIMVIATVRCPHVRSQTCCTPAVHLLYTPYTDRPAVHCTPAVHCRPPACCTLPYTVGLRPAVHRPYTVHLPYTVGPPTAVHLLYTVGPPTAYTLRTPSVHTRRTPSPNTCRTSIRGPTGADTLSTFGVLLILLGFVAWVPVG